MNRPTYSDCCVSHVFDAIVFLYVQTISAMMSSSMPGEAEVLYLELRRLERFCTHVETLHSVWMDVWMTFAVFLAILMAGTTDRRLQYCYITKNYFFVISPRFLCVNAYYRTRNVLSRVWDCLRSHTKRVVSTKNASMLMRVTSHEMRCPNE